VLSPLVIGFVNNMPDTALRTTERQFRELLDAAARGRPLDLRLYALPDAPRSDAGRAYLGDRYQDISALWHNPVDGLIVTGAEPATRALTEEPYWPSLARLVDWAEQNTSSAVWSCLAAHAAVFRIDGIERQPLDGKLSGVFDCAIAIDHPMTASAPRSWCIPHSRCHGLSQQALVDKGYTILLRSDETGPDIFLKERKSLFLFIQGHPEYDAHALLREYRRDVDRFLAGRRHDYPEIPSAYFDGAAAASLAAFRARAERDGAAALMEPFPDVQIDEAVPQRWRASAVRLYQNWLAFLAERKLQRGGGGFA
jgi:homoserine O-succinyltransferase/O-acetyltransferase